MVSEIERAGLPSRGWAFARQDGRRGQVQPWRVSAIANQFLHDVGLSVTYHQLRHRFATRAYDLSLNQRAIQELLGHGSITSTSVYTKVSQAKLASIVAALPVPETAVAAAS
jgi:integrase/recombinase XerC